MSDNSQHKNWSSTNPVPRRERELFSDYKIVRRDTALAYEKKSTKIIFQVPGITFDDYLRTFGKKIRVLLVMSNRTFDLSIAVITVLTHKRG